MTVRHVTADRRLNQNAARDEVRLDVPGSKTNILALSPCYS